MKRMLSLFVLIAGLPLFADQEIALPPGSSIDLNGMHVRCMGSAHTPPACSVSCSGPCYVSVGSKTWGHVESLDKAVRMTIELKQAGLCS